MSNQHETPWAHYGLTVRYKVFPLTNQQRNYGRCEHCGEPANPFYRGIAEVMHAAPQAEPFWTRASDSFGHESCIQKSMEKFIYFAR